MEGFLSFLTRRKDKRMGFDVSGVSGVVTGSGAVQLVAFVLSLK